MATWMKFLSVHSYIFAQCSALHTLIHTQLHSGAKTNMKGTISLTLSTRSSSFFRDVREGDRRVASLKIFADLTAYSHIIAHQKHFPDQFLRLPCDITLPSLISTDTICGGCKAATPPLLTPFVSRCLYGGKATRLLTRTPLLDQWSQETPLKMG
ncbi:MAG: hypothetical protein NXY57DRAFT_1011493 [Lentinula lateritia]|nr:MAG: hypothetical protein NXY57DRAFT_1011493 [Lentinula lateritia]